MDRTGKLIPLLSTDAALITRPENMYYLSGYRGEGCLLITKQAKIIITDFRYVEQAEIQSPDWRVEQTTAGRSAWKVLTELRDELKYTGLSAETDVLTYDAYTALSNALDGIVIRPMGDVISRLRWVKDESELDCIRKAAAISCKAFMQLLEWVRPGMTEREVAIRLDHEMLLLGSECPAFSTIAAAGKNGSLPHAVPGDHVIENGELLTLDFGATKGGYRSDMTRTVGFGRVGDELKRIYQYVLDAQLMSLEAVGPGKTGKEIDAIARNYLDSKYPGRFGHSLGHGVGLQIHEGPNLNTRSETVLAPGHVVTVEPGLYIPGLGGCRIEDMALITAEGFIDPIDAPKQLIEL